MALRPPQFEPVVQEESPIISHNSSLPQVQDPVELVLGKIPKDSFQPSSQFPNIHEASLVLPTLNSKSPLSFSLALQDIPDEYRLELHRLAGYILYGIHQLKHEIAFSPSLEVERVAVENGGIVTARVSEPPAGAVEVAGKAKYSSPDQLRMSVSGLLIPALIKNRLATA